MLGKYKFFLDVYNIRMMYVGRGNASQYIYRFPLPTRKSLLKLLLSIVAGSNTPWICTNSMNNICVHIRLAGKKRKQKRVEVIQVCVLCQLSTLHIGYNDAQCWERSGVQSALLFVLRLRATYSEHGKY